MLFDGAEASQMTSRSSSRAYFDPTLVTIGLFARVTRVVVLAVIIVRSDSE